MIITDWSAWGIPLNGVVKPERRENGLISKKAYHARVTMLTICLACPWWGASR
jgi:hypothetical protein